ncbi:MAG: CoB--CoM heterodisulfide reductase iron-sulfur subunit B family protein [Candidatus Thorarchaeota archaeon]|jgi:heterodisulfide reductase subunit B
MEYFLYTGCTAPVRLPAYEASTIAVLTKLGVNLTHLRDANCCGAQYIESMSREAFTALSGRILALAERYEKDICTICGACSGSLKHAQHAMDHDEELKKEVNANLAEEDLEYVGKVEVKHLLQILNEDIGIDAIRKAVVKPYEELPLAAHYGCHLTRPYEIAQVDNPEDPTIIDKIVEALGATSTDYAGKTRCCGGPLLAMDEAASSMIGLEKISNIRAAGGAGLVTVCGFCDIQLTQVQFGGDLHPGDRIPVITLPQLMGVAMGIDEDKLGIYLNKIEPERILSATQEVG